MDPITLEKYSSAITLSDMEVFLFPELLYALVLANIMSPRIWAWKDDSWFRNLEGLSWNRRLQRLKQYIMEHYSFNLDLETWGLTTKSRELERFRGVTSPETLARSNALFGYEGDQYYFDLDIRRHFGLDAYDSDVIPYWKTETVEAMDAFVHKPGHRQGAGECVSLSALYAAALHIVLGVPLENIFLLATPLHSQNFVLLGDGVLTNNRRLVTKAMWFNGTALSQKARRALEKERVTIVAHLSGYIHIDYDDATIDPLAYQRCSAALGRFLTTAVDFEIFINFLRAYHHYQKYFQFEYLQEGHRYHLEAEKLFYYEHGSQNRICGPAREKLLAEVDADDFSLQPLPGRFVLNAIEERLQGKVLECRAEDTCREFKTSLASLPGLDAFCRDLQHFACTTPRLPSADKRYAVWPRPDLPPGLTREEIIARLSGLRGSNATVDLAFLAGRRIETGHWEAFLKACWERNPVSLKVFENLPGGEVCQQLQAWPEESIYDGQGLATPDEVVNFQRGDGLEKAICLANVLLSKNQRPLSLEADAERVQVAAAGAEYVFTTRKGLRLSRWEV